MSGEEDKKDKKNGFRESFRKGMNYHGVIDLWKRTLAGEKPRDLMKERRKLYPKETVIMLTFAYSVYGVIAYYLILTLLEPVLVSVYDFTVGQATAIGVVVEGELMSASIFGLIVYILARRFGRREKELLKAISELTEEIKRMRKSREKGGD